MFRRAGLFSAIVPADFCAQVKAAAWHICLCSGGCSGGISMHSRDTLIHVILRAGLHSAFVPSDCCAPGEADR